jgi:hypothetical protein
MSIGKAWPLGDVNAVQPGSAVPRIERRLVGQLMGRLLGRLYW